jgi:molybdate transport system substrate-binding protein
MVLCANEILEEIVMNRRSSLKQALQLLWSGAAVTMGFARAEAPSDKTLRVAAASDLKFVLPLLLAQFQQESGIKTEANFGSSGNFARQIRQGLPVDLFMSADESWVEHLAQAGFTRSLRSAAGAVRDRGVIYALGRIALYVPRDSTLSLDTALAGLQAGWKQVVKFALANPEHAPYGRAAREALEKLGLWELIKPKLVLGENIAQATQFVATGAAQAGITALSLALAPQVAQLGRHVALPAELHSPLRQRMVLTQSAPPHAQQLYAFLQTPQARTLFKKYGFEV